MKRLLLTAYGFSTPTIGAVYLKMIHKNKVTKACIISTSWPKEKEKHPQMNQIKNDLIDMDVTKVDYLMLNLKMQISYMTTILFFQWWIPILPIAFSKKERGRSYFERKVP